MGIYISGMKMPIRCIDCHLNYDSCACILTGSRFYKYNMEFNPSKERLSDCPLVYVSEDGDLINKNALIEDMARMVPWAITDPTANAFLDGLSAAYKAIKNAPAIIPAEEHEI